jgi:hypothetical protein
MSLSKFVDYTSTIGGLDKTMNLVGYIAQFYTAFYQPNQSLSNLSSALSDVRYSFRLNGLVSTLQSLGQHNLSKLTTNDYIRISQDFSMVLYYLCDNGYWLSGKGVFAMEPSTRNQISRVSCQMWALYIVLDMICDSQAKMDEKEKIYRFVLNFTNLLMAVEWSLTKGILPARSVPVLGLAASILTISKSWYNFS